MHMVRHAQFDTGVPPGAVKHQHDLLVWASTNLTRELGQFDLEEGNGDTRRQVENGAPRGRMDEADEVAPRKTVLDGGGRTLANRCPDPPQEWFQADAMLVGGPDLDVSVRIRRGDGLDQRPQLFLKVSCWSGSASACCGRGAC